MRQRRVAARNQFWSDMTRRYFLALDQCTGVKRGCRMKSARLVFLTLSFVPFPLWAATATPTRPAAATDQVEAADLSSLQAKAERGNAVAQYNLGLAHLQGRQTPVNL